MYDLAIPAERPGICPKCQGSGQYQWGPLVNGKPKHAGECYSCRGTGQQSRARALRLPDVARSGAGCQA